ncbi:tryptophan--tRNA ligase [Thalassospira alkalitolerans]|uniref:Tryptophan--tRNA ligase n=1 Tax=Thalassospira alkalitolerans TaxID=1293890 RepID=A0A1Y2LGI6_9PROT|nr:tryptophan--tRNA ligase [Thalassospira alkalitolerans]OSQ50459.1 tryptophanyl-tRNA synthetase [Thalassospira alkalitolerans]
MERIFSGAQPTGNLHLGNYLGAIRNWVTLQKDFECIFCVVDLHAITVWQNPQELRSNIRELAASMIASGVDPEKHVLFNQSQVSAHAELAWIFNCVARLGWLNRMTQFKEKAGKHRENASLGLYAYPSLMAADILAYKATHVPVGEDQKQHLELTRDIAAKFNNDFEVDFFPQPEPLILGPATRVMSLRDGTKKMSKSDSSDMSRINMTDDADTLAKKIRKAKTDAEPLPSEAAGLEGRPEAKNLITIYAALTDIPVADILAEHGGTQFSGFKQALTDVVVEKLAPITSEMTRLKADNAYIDATLAKGADRADAIAQPILREVKEIVGFLNR